MNTTAAAIIAGIVRQVIIACSGALVAYGAKLDDGGIEIVTGVVVAIITACYSALKKTKIYKQLEDKTQ